MSKQKKNFFYTWTSQESALSFELQSAKGAFIQTKEYGKLLDLSSTSYHVGFGHNHLAIQNEIKKQLYQFSTASPKANFKLKEEISSELIKLLALGPGRILYTVSGAESVENALKMARQLSGKKYIASLEKSYHGATLGALAVTGDWRHHLHWTPSEYTLRLPSPQIDKDGTGALEAIHKLGADKLAAICLETISGGNGVFTGTKKWWQAIEKICREKNILLILDEVVCGFFRTGKAFGFHHFKLKPDIVCLAKSISGGHIPFGAVYLTEKHARVYDQKVFSYGLTQYAHPLGLAACKGVFKIIKSASFKKNLPSLIKTLKSNAAVLKKIPSVIDYRQHGLLAAIELKTPFSQDKLFESGLYLLSTGHNLILAPPLTCAANDLKKGLNRLNSLLEEHF